LASLKLSRFKLLGLLRKDPCSVDWVKNISQENWTGLFVLVCARLGLQP